MGSSHQLQSSHSLFSFSIVSLCIVLLKEELCFNKGLQKYSKEIKSPSSGGRAVPGAQWGSNLLFISLGRSADFLQTRAVQCVAMSPIWLLSP